MAEQVPMPASMSKRTDNNNSARVKRIQNDGTKIQNASGGTYNARNTLNQLAQGASTDVSAPSMPAPVTPVVSRGQSTNIFDPNDPNDTFTNGAGGNTAGTGPDSLMSRFNTHDAGYVLLAAMYQMNPTPEIARMLEAYNEEGIF